MALPNRKATTSFRLAHNPHFKPITLSKHSRTLHDYCTVRLNPAVCVNVPEVAVSVSV
jgi:hypothetical protein